MLQPVVISSGVAGWQFLQRTYDRQVDAFSQGALLKRETDQFAEKIGTIVRAEDLVSDRQLLKVALGAFGLQDDLNNRFFIQKMLEEGTTANDALANRFADSRYREFSSAFGLGPNEIPQTLRSGFAAEIVDRYVANSFEVAVGEQNDSMRIALYAERVLPEIVSRDVSSTTKWFSILGQAALREVFQTALNLPSEFAQVDLDRQVEVFEERSRSLFGSDDPSTFSDPDVLQDIVTTYLARSEINSIGAGQSGASIALTLLQG